MIKQPGCHTSPGNPVLMEEWWFLCVFAGGSGTASSSTCQPTLMLSELSNWETHSLQPLDSLAISSLRIMSCTHNANVYLRKYTLQPKVRSIVLISELHLHYSRNLSSQIIKRKLFVEMCLTVLQTIHM